VVHGQWALQRLGRLADQLTVNIGPAARVRQQPLGNEPHGDVLEVSNPIPLNRLESKQVRMQRRAARHRLAKAPLVEVCFSVNELYARLLLTDAAARSVRIDERDGGLLLGGRGDELAHAVLRLEVTPRAVDEHGVRPIDVPFQVANLLEVVDI